MVKLRLRRKGRIHHPVYDIVAMDERKKRDGAYLERLGYFDPHHQPSTISIDHSRAIYWLDNGAQPTDIVRNLMSVDGVLLRRHLGFKGKNDEEIEAEVAKHKESATARYFKQKDKRKQKKLDKIKAEEDAKKAEEEAAAAPPAEEAPAENSAE